MADQATPRVKLPEASIRKPVIPGPNSWAQSLEQGKRSSKEKETVKPTNRDKYENKPVPDLPAEASHGSQAALLQPRAFIQPAVPLVNTLPPGPKNRAVTEPVQPKSLLTNSKPSVTQLRKKFSSSKHGSTDETDLPYSNVPGKALELLGMQQKPVPTPLAAPTRTQTPDQRRSAEDVPKVLISAPNSTCQTQTSPVPTRLSLGEQEADNSKVTITQTANQEPIAQPLNRLDFDLAESTRIQNETDNKNLQTHKVTAYGNIGKIGVVEQHGLHSSGSFRGVIEMASPARTEEQNNNELLGTPTRTLRHQLGVELLPATTYSPKAYDRIWGNDSAVGRTLPPFTPMPNMDHPNSDQVPRGLFQSRSRHARNAFEDNLPETGQRDGLVEQGNTHRGGPGVRGTVRSNESGEEQGTHHNGPGWHLQEAQQAYSTQYAQQNYQQSESSRGPLASGNSWATGSQGNSVESSNAPISALLPRHWPAHHNTNAVPSPPHSQHDYQRPIPSSSELARLELTLHHHIDKVFGSLSKQISDKHDLVIDRVLVRVENFEEIVKKELKTLNKEVTTIRREVGKLRTSVSEVAHGDDAIMQLLQDLGNKIGGLEKSIEENSCKGSHSTAEQDASDGENDRLQRQVNHRRTQSSHSSSGHGERRIQQQGGASRASSKFRQSGNVGRGHRSNTITSQPENRSSDDREVRRAVFAQLGKIGKLPDLRHHSAYAGMPQEANLFGGEREMLAGGMAGQDPYGTQPLGGGGWYQQAYGNGI